MDFTQTALRDFLTRAKAQVGVYSLGEAAGAPGLILRHDIDFDLGAALEVARLEAALGLGASFFVLLGSHLYNAAEAQNRARLRAIAALGFEIGLHFDPTLYDEVPLSQQAAVVREAAWLGELAGVEIRSVSLHNPSLSGRYPLFSGFRNAYAPEFFGADRYLSDSGRRFRQDPEAFVLQGRERLLQLLLHPAHYPSEGASSYHALGERLLRAYDARFHAELGVNPGYRRERSAAPEEAGTT